MLSQENYVMNFEFGDGINDILLIIRILKTNPNKDILYDFGSVQKKNARIKKNVHTCQLFSLFIKKNIIFMKSAVTTVLTDGLGTRT